MTYLLDTNIIQAILDNKGKVTKKIERVTERGIEKIFISGISYYEIMCGLLTLNLADERHARKLVKFKNFCDTFDLLLLDKKDIFDKAAEIYALLPKGVTIELADLLITSIANSHNFILVSDDQPLIDKVENLNLHDFEIQDWLKD